MPFLWVLVVTGSHICLRPVGGCSLSLQNTCHSRYFESFSWISNPTISKVTAELFASLFTNPLHTHIVSSSFLWFVTAPDFDQCCWNFICSAQSSPVSSFPKPEIAMQPITWWVMYLLHLVSCGCSFLGQPINVSLGLLLRTLLPCQLPHWMPPWLLPHSVACHI